MPARNVAERACPLARAMSVLGDRWTLLILWRLRSGVHRFDAILSETGIAPNMLSKRLRRMEDDGLIERRPYQVRPSRYEYHATVMAGELDAVLLLLRDWGERHRGDQEAP